MSLSSPCIPKTSSSVTLLKPHVQNAGPHVSTSIWRKGLVVKNAHRLFPAWSEEDRKTLSIFKILLLSWLPYHTYPPRSLSPYLLHCFSVCLCVSHWHSTTVTVKEILPCSYGHRQLPIIACLCHMVALPLVLACRSSSFQMGLFHFKILQIHLAEEILTTRCDRSWTKTQAQMSYVGPKREFKKKKDGREEISKRHWILTSFQLHCLLNP